ncbi:AraC family transcriptional regulator [Limimaricola pyoseonensis]|nr:AraC family transcriptional regulator ligand-binding domain-containing protein [Limimaricola pyoseonensis]
MGWGLILGQLGIDPQDVLRSARLPLDLFRREAASLDSAEYFRLWQAMERVSGDPLLPLRLARAMTAETFSPALFACLCSESLDAALARLALYKPLIGPMHLSVEKDASETVVEIRGLPGDIDPPPSLIAGELVFFTHLARLGLRERIVPTRVESPVPLPQPHAFADWLGCAPRHGEAARVAFRGRDAERPFLTANPAMWAAFEPGLRQRLSDATAQTSMAGRLRGWFNETIASGRVSINEAARDLGVSGRTLQRRLSAEDTSFQKELSAVRERLARHYLTQTRLSTGEIAFLLGYAEPNSFYRALHGWTGATPDRIRSGGGVVS